MYYYGLCRGGPGNLRNITIIKNAGNYGKINVVT